MSLTHAEAHTLIQCSLDHPLSTDEDNALSAHLQTCPACRAYAADMQDVDTSLRAVAQRYWNAPHPPLSMDALTGHAAAKPLRVWAAQLAIASIVFVTVALSAWQVAQPGWTTNTKTPLSVSPIPTPSIQTASARPLPQECREIRYIVQEGDTLEGIAGRFSTSVKIIQNGNGFASATVVPGMEVRIPVCGATPSSTVHSPAFTNTTTPPVPLTMNTP
ncbi:MAG: hypothetical protein DPW18_08410 [Chloroflexi bacterium]|nr:hypothetical protein [Chloroflexota bacterium]MDL1941796.1 LysM peptidoglycan-binding domain-containing protein [Chloroflexi bacterium CFX2]